MIACECVFIAVELHNSHTVRMSIKVCIVVVTVSSGLGNHSNHTVYNNIVLGNVLFSYLMFYYFK